jgi:MFS family permease|eukprot:COSAG06_NODE_566_length_14196_cov_2.916578_11_plen_140_part_00
MTWLPGRCCCCVRRALPLRAQWAMQFGLTGTARTGKLLDLCKHDMATLNFCNTVLWTTGNLTIALVSPLIGALSDRFGRLPILFQGRLGLAVWLWTTAASSKLWQFMLADWITWGLVSAATQSVEVRLSSPRLPATGLW